MDIELYRQSTVEIPVQPGKRFREWMSPYAYRCLPLAAANMLGWDVCAPCRITAMWNGEADQEAVVVTQGADIAAGHFGLGTFTLKFADVWKTEPGVQLLIMPVPNMEFRGVMSLTAVVETDRLDYPWFVTMRMLRKGTITIEKDEPLCRVIPIRISDVTNCKIAYKPQPDESVANGAELKAAREAGKGQWTKIYQRQARHTSIRSPEVGSGETCPLAAHGILAVEDFLSASECARIVAMRETTDPDWQGDEYWKGRTRFGEWPDEILARLEEIPAMASKFFGSKKMCAEPYSLTDWDAGVEMPPHSDHGGRGEYPSRHYASVLYLNDDFEGGEIYFPQLGLEAIPQRGLLLVFAGGTLLHGVRKVISGRRMTAISWLCEL